MDGEHDLFSRAVGVMDEEGPVQAFCLGGKGVAVCGEPLLVALAQSFGAPGDHAVAAFARSELGAALVGKRLLGGIEDLHEVAAHALFGDRLDARGSLLNRLEEIAEQQALGEAAERCRRRQARSLACVSHQDLGDAARSVAAGVRPVAKNADTLAGAGEKLGERKPEHDGAAFLRRPRQARAELHGGRKIDPQPNGVRRLPFPLAHEEMVGASRAPPIDAGAGIVVVEMTELPEGLARPRAPAAMAAMGHGMGDALCLDQERWHARGKRVGLGLLGRKRMQSFRLAIGQAQITPAA